MSCSVFIYALLSLIALSNPFHYTTDFERRNSIISKRFGDKTFYHKNAKIVKFDWKKATFPDFLNGLLTSKLV